MGSILNIGVSALTAFQRQLDTTAHNIANANTDGYSRQRVNLATNTPRNLGIGFVGTGTHATSVERVYDDFLVAQVQSGTSSTSELEVYASYAGMLDDIFADSSTGLGPSLQGFFDAVQGVSNDPSSTSERQLFIAESQAMVDRLHALDRQASNIRHTVNRDLSTAVDEINSLADSLAEINQQIITAYGIAGGNHPNDLLDRRDTLVAELSELVNISSTVAQDNGALNVFIGSGQALVVNTQASTLTVINGTADLEQKEITLTGLSGTQTVTDQLNGGRLGGLLSFREDILDPSQNELGLVAAGLALEVNQQHQLGVDLNGNLGGNFFTPPTIGVAQNTNNTGAGTITASYSDASNLTSSDYELTFNGGTSYTLTRLSDDTTTAIDTGGASPYTTAEVDGFTLTITAGAVAGDSFLVRPTRNAARDIDLQVSNVNTIAAAGPLRGGEATDTNGVPTNTGSGVIGDVAISDTTNIPLSGSGGDITLTFDSNAGGAGIPGFVVTGGLTTTLLYDPSTESSGKSFTLATKGGATFTLSGVPADGDSFVISDNTSGTGDNRNALALADLQSTKGMLGGTATFQDLFANTVSDIGSKTHNADINYESQLGLLNQAQASWESVSGVNLDEEAANLIQFQQAYQAAAQVISVASSLFDTLLGAVRR